MRRGKAIGDPVKLRWFGPAELHPGDVLVTNTGRRYVVRKVSGKTIHCVVGPPTLKPTLRMHWVRRR